MQQPMEYIDMKQIAIQVMNVIVALFLITAIAACDRRKPVTERVEIVVLDSLELPMKDRTVSILPLWNLGKSEQEKTNDDGLAIFKSVEVALEGWIMTTNHGKEYAEYSIRVIPNSGDNWEQNGYYFGRRNLVFSDSSTNYITLILHADLYPISMAIGMLKL
jgi:hypothetical protein